MVANGSSAKRPADIEHGLLAGGGPGRTADRRRRRAVGGRPGARVRPAPVHRHAVASPDGEDMHGYEWIEDATDEGIDPAFDECGDLADHVDGLAARMRRELCRWGGDDSWTEAD